MEEKLKVMIDMDEVITHDCFTELMEEFLGRKIDLYKEKVLWRQDLIKGREDEFREKMQYRNLYENSILKEGCYDVIKKLNEKFDVYISTTYVWGYEIINSAENLKNKFNFLRKNLDFIDPNKFIFMSNKNMINYDIKIDDNVKNLDGAKTKICFYGTYNQNFQEDELRKKGIIRVKSWKEIEEILLNNK